MNRQQALWLGFALVVVHNVEELLTMGRFLDVHRSHLPSFVQSMTGDWFAISLLIATLVILLVYWLGARSRPRGGWLVLAIGLQVAVGVNGLQHAGAALWAGGYVPGVVTGLLLSVPYAAYVAKRALREQWVTARQLVVASVVLVLLEVPLLVTLHTISSLFL